MFVCFFSEHFVDFFAKTYCIEQTIVLIYGKQAKYEYMFLMYLFCKKKSNRGRSVPKLFNRTFFFIIQKNSSYSYKVSIVEPYGFLIVGKRAETETFRVCGLKTGFQTIRFNINGGIIVNLKRLVRKGICAVLIAGMLAGSAPAYASDGRVFLDVPKGYWAEQVILEGFRDGAAGGTRVEESTGKRYFSPETEMTCAQFSALLAKAFYPVELNSVGAQTKWYGSAQIVCNNHNLYNGVSGKIEEDLSRYDMAVMMCNLLIDQKIEMPSERELRNFVQKIPDYTVMPADYQDPVLKVYTLGLLKGIDSTGAFLGEACMTRAQSMAVYCRLKGVLKNQELKPEESIPVTPLEPALPNPEMKPAEKPEIGLPNDQSLANGKPMTTENIQEMLIELKKEYPSGMKWDEADTYTSDSVYAMGFGETGGCTSFAFMIQDKIYGKDLKKHMIIRHHDFSKIKPGDILHFKGEKETSGHYLVVTHVGSTSTGPQGLIPEDYEGGWEGSIFGCSGNVAGHISWGDLSDVRDLNENFEIISRI